MRGLYPELDLFWHSVFLPTTASHNVLKNIINSTIAVVRFSSCTRLRNSDLMTTDTLTVWLTHWQSKNIWL